MSVSLTKSPSVPAALSAGSYVLLPGDPAPFLVWHVQHNPDGTGPAYVRLFGAFDAPGRSMQDFRTLPERRRLPVLPG